MLCPGAQHCTGPMHHAVAVGWMVQRSSNLPPFLRSSGNLIFLKHLRRQVQRFRHNSNRGAPFPFLCLGKPFSPLISTLSGASSPHPSLSFFPLFVIPFPPSHMVIHFPISSLFLYQKNQTGRETQKPWRHPSLVPWRNSVSMTLNSTDPEYQVPPRPVGMRVGVSATSQTCHGTGLRG